MLERSDDAEPRAVGRDVALVPARGHQYHDYHRHDQYHGDAGDGLQQPAALTRRPLVSMAFPLVCDPRGRSCAAARAMSVLVKVSPGAPGINLR